MKLEGWELRERATALGAIRGYIQQGNIWCPTQLVAAHLGCTDAVAAHVLRGLEDDGLVVSKRYDMDAGRYVEWCWRTVEPEQLPLF